MNEETNLPDGLQLAVKLLAKIGDDESDRAISDVHDLAEAHAQRLTLQHHAADQVWRIADLEVKCVTLKRLHDAAADERNTARGAVRELERQVFALQQQRDVLQTCLDRHQRDEVDPPGYLQDAVIRAAGLGALHTERDAAIKERDELRARLAGIEAGAVPGEWIKWQGGACPIADDVQHQVRKRDGWESGFWLRASTWYGWHCSGSTSDIVAYRVLP